LHLLGVIGGVSYLSALYKGEDSLKMDHLLTVNFNPLERETISREREALPPFLIPHSNSLLVSLAPPLYLQKFG